MLPSRGSGGQRGTASNRKPRGSLGRGNFGKRNPTTTTATSAKGDTQSTKIPPVAQTGPKSSAPFARGGGAFKNNTFRPTAQTFTPKSTSNLKSDDYNGRYTSLKRSREQERKQAIANGFLADPDHPRSLANAITPVGTCQDMCAEFERVERVVQQDVWAPEKTPDKSGPDEARMVKKFRRAAAGLEEQLPSDLRPPQVLKHTIDFLIDDILLNAPTLASVHYFIWDRTRAVRNDFSIQQVSKPEDLQIAIDCYERIARFHIMSLHQLSGPEKPYDNYDAQQEREQLDKTLLSILQYYDDNRRKIPLPNEAEFRSYSIIFQIQTLNPDLEDRMQTWPRELLTNVRIERALKLYTLVCNASDPQGPFRRWSKAHPIAQANWAGFWALIKSGEISYLMGCVAEIYFPYVRTMALNAILRAYKHGGKDKNGKPIVNEDWSLADMKDVLGLEDEDAIENLLAQVGLDVGTRADGQRYFDLNTASGKSPLAPVLPTSAVVEQKRFRRTLTAVVNGMSVRAAHESGMVDQDEDEDEDESLFLPDQPGQSSAPTAFTGGLSQNNNSQPPFGNPSNPTNPFAAAIGSSGPAASFPSSSTPNPAQPAFTSAFPSSSKESAKKTVHFSEDTKPASNTSAQQASESAANATAQKSAPLFSFFPSTPATSTTTTASQPGLFSQAQTNTNFSNTGNGPLFTSPVSTTTESQTAIDEESAKRLAAEKAAREQRDAEEQAARKRESEEKAAQEAQEARERAAKEQAARMQAAKEKALQEKLAREQAAQARARQEAEARQAEEQRRREQERIARELEREQQKALDVVSEQLTFGDGGLFDQFVEFRLSPMIQQAVAQVEQEDRAREADWFRETVLTHRYGRLWREVCVKRRLQRRGAEKRKRAKRDAQLRAEHAKSASIEAELKRFRLQSAEGRARSDSVTSSQPSNKENDPITSHITGDPHSSRRPRATRRIVSGALPSPLNPSASQSSDFGASLLYNQVDGSMPPPPRRNEDGFGISTSTLSNSRGSSLTRSVGDIESIRSTYVPSASQTSETNGILYGQKYDTTRSTYFKLRAMGLDPNSSTLFPERRIPQSEKKRSRTSDGDSMGIIPRKRAQTLNGGSRASHSPLNLSLQAADGNAIDSIEPGADDATEKDADDDDPVIAMARRARAAMQEGSSLFREASRMLSSTPDRSATQHRHQRHQSYSALADSSHQTQSGSPRPHRPAVSRFLNRIPRADRQKYTDAAALELAEEDAKEEALSKARANKELRDAEEAVERERLRQSQALMEATTQPLLRDTAPNVKASFSSAQHGQGLEAKSSMFTSQSAALDKSSLDASSMANNETLPTSALKPILSARETNGYSVTNTNPFASAIATFSSTSQPRSPFGQSFATALSGQDVAKSKPVSATLDEPSTALKPDPFGKPSFQAENLSRDHGLAHSQQSQKPSLVAKPRPRQQPPAISRSANMFAALAGEDDGSGSESGSNGAGDEEDGEGDETQGTDDDESVGFSEEEQDDLEEEDEDEDMEENEDEDGDDMPAPDPTKWQGKSGTSVEDAIEL